MMNKNKLLKLNLQHFADGDNSEARKGMLEGKNKILLFRRLKDSDEEAAKLAFQTEHTFSLERDTDSIPTKDGTVVKLGDLEGEVAGIEAVQAKDDPVATMLQGTVLYGEKLELWEVTVDEDLKKDDKYPAMYAQGYLTTWEAAAPTEDESTYSGDFTIELVPQFGFATLTVDQEEAVQYAFKDTIPEEEGAIHPETPADLAVGNKTSDSIDLYWN